MSNVGGIQLCDRATKNNTGKMYIKTRTKWKGKGGKENE